MRVLVVHGPNLNLLGEREPNVYGTQTLAQVNDAIAGAAKSLGLDVRCEQHNAEGAIIDALHEARKSCSGVVINPGAYAHYSYAIADAIAAIGIPVIEVQGVTAAACRGVVSGLGVSGYLLALRALAELLA